MRSASLFAAAITIALGLAGCGTVDNALFGSDDGSQATAPAVQPGTMPGTLPGSGGTMAATPAPSAGASADTSAGMASGMADNSGQGSGQGPSQSANMSMAAGTTAPITAISIEPGSDTGTAVGHTVAGMRSELIAMQGKIVGAANRLAALKNRGAQYAAAYHTHKATITTRLQVGTTRGNPRLVAQWNAAQSALDSLTGNINAMNTLGTQVADISSNAHYILSTIQATYNVSGAVDEDHRQLSVLEDETNQTIVLINRLLKEVSNDIQRQTSYVANERGALTTLSAAIKNGELYGSALGVSSPAPVASAGAPSGAALVTIRFDHRHVEYQQILYTALNQALQSRPNATFSVMAVSPTRGTASAVQLAQTAAQSHAQEILRAMTDMGVPGSRLAISSSTDPSIAAPEVRVYVH
jgi:hypothetical protein